MGLLPVRFLAHTLRCLGRLPPPFLFFRSVLVVGFRCVGSGADCKRPTGGWNTRMACLKDPPPPRSAEGAESIKTGSPDGVSLLRCS